MTLHRHLRVAHGLEPAAYRIRWKLPANHALTALVYSERRTDVRPDRGDRQAMILAPADVSP